MKKLYYMFALLGMFPLFASAHVKWFVDSADITGRLHGSSPFYSLNSKEVLIWTIITIIIVAFFGVIDHYLQTPKKLLSYGIKHENVINRISQIILGSFLILVSFLWKVIIVPDFVVDSSNMITIVLQYLQIAIGLMYLFNIKPKIASIGLILFCIGISITQNPITILENAMLLSLGIYFFIVNSKDNKMVYKYHKHAVEIVRIGTGISLITLAFTEKLLYPELSMSFLDVHHWNFMQGMFPWFDNQLFVLSTGFAEMIFGILFILGYITRITTILIAVFFMASVSTMLIQFNAWEVEDLVVYSAALLFIFYGHGKTKFFHFVCPTCFIDKKN